jgi:hypothetical protein
MLIDRQSRPWIFSVVAIFLIATVFYVPYHRSALPTISGGSWPGLIYGIIGTAMMAFAMLLSLKKRLRTAAWLGRAFTWTQGHVWLGLLAYPLVLYHSGLRFGPVGSVAWWLMILFTAIVVSGIFGIVLQNIIPRRMLGDVPMETIYEQIDHILAKLRDEADAKVRAATESAGGNDPVVAFSGGTTVLAAPLATPLLSQSVLLKFHEQELLPFLRPTISSSARRLLNLNTSQAAFENLRLSLPPRDGAPLMHDVVDDLEHIADERRQLARQQWMHGWLHTWLLIHVPLSFALTVLAAWHIVVALRYL